MVKVSLASSQPQKHGTDESQVTGAIGISGPVWRLSVETLQKRARLVRAAAEALSADFGYAGEGESRVKASV